MGVTLPTRQVGVKVGVKTTIPRPLERPGDKSVPKYWQERQDSNLRPPVLETGALPTELRSFAYLLQIG